MAPPANYSLFFFKNNTKPIPCQLSYLSFFQYPSMPASETGPVQFPLRALDQAALRIGIKIFTK